MHGHNLNRIVNAKLVCMKSISRLCIAHLVVSKKTMHNMPYCHRTHTLITERNTKSLVKIMEEFKPGWKHTHTLIISIRSGSFSASCTYIDLRKRDNKEQCGRRRKRVVKGERGERC